MSTVTNTFAELASAKGDPTEAVAALTADQVPAALAELAALTPVQSSSDIDAVNFIHKALIAFATIDGIDAEHCIKTIHNDFTLGNQFLEKFLTQLGENKSTPEYVVGIIRFLTTNGYGDHEAILYQLSVMNSENMSIPLLAAFMDEGIMKDNDSFWTVCWDEHMANVRMRFFQQWLEEYPDMKLIPLDFAERMWFGWLPESIRVTVPESLLSKNI